VPCFVNNSSTSKGISPFQSDRTRFTNVSVDDTDDEVDKFGGKGKPPSRYDKVDEVNNKSDGLQRVLQMVLQHNCNKLAFPCSPFLGFYSLFQLLRDRYPASYSH
jgi:hypothetical protein